MCVCRSVCMCVRAHVCVPECVTANHRPQSPASPYTYNRIRCSAKPEYFPVIFLCAIPRPHGHFATREQENMRGRLCAHLSRTFTPSTYIVCLPLVYTPALHTFHTFTASAAYPGMNMRVQQLSSCHSCTPVCSLSI